MNNKFVISQEKTTQVSRNCLPTPPLSPHFALSEEFVLTLSQGRRQVGSFPEISNHVSRGDQTNAILQLSHSIKPGQLKSNFPVNRLRYFLLVYTVNDLINDHFQINASYLINTPSTWVKFYQTPLSNKRSLSNRRENQSKILGISKKGAKSSNSFTFLLD